jgi:hypothetical protein
MSCAAAARSFEDTGSEARGGVLGPGARCGASWRFVATEAGGVRTGRCADQFAGKVRRSDLRRHRGRAGGAHGQAYALLPHREDMLRDRAKPRSDGVGLLGGRRNCTLPGRPALGVPSPDFMRMADTIRSALSGET